MQLSCPGQQVVTVQFSRFLLLSSGTRQRDLNKTVLRHHPSSGFHPSSSLLPLLCRSEKGNVVPRHPPSFSTLLLTYGPSAVPPSSLPSLSFPPSLVVLLLPPPPSPILPPALLPPSLPSSLPPSFLPPPSSLSRSRLGSKPLQQLCSRRSRDPRVLD